MIMTQLEIQIIEASKSYYNGTPIMTDLEWDSKLEELRQTNPNSKVLQGVGWGYGPQDSELPTKTHKLQNIHGFDKIFMDQPTGVIPIGTYTPKYDGASITLYYTNGELESAITRGDGSKGSDVTDKLRYIVPLKIDPRIKAISGEWIISKSNFKKYYPSTIAHRNTAVGILMRKSYDPAELLRFDFIAYRIEESTEPLPEINSDGREGLTELLLNNGFNTTPYIENLSNQQTYQHMMDEFSKSVDYYCDGLVYELDIFTTPSNTYTYCNEVAYKFNHNKVKTTVTEVVWSFTRTGKMVPVVNYEPIELSGAVCQRATAYNAAYIRDNSIGVGSEIVVTRSGEVIPYILESNPASNVELPTVCPKCGEPLVWKGLDLVCENTSCDGQIYSRLYNYIEVMGASEIKGASTSVINLIIDTFKLDVPSDIYKIQGTFISRLYQQGSATARLAAKVLTKLKSPADFSQMLVGLSIPGVGYGVSSKISSRVFEYCESSMKSDVVDYWILSDIKSIGESIEESINQYRALILDTYEAIVNSVGFESASEDEVDSNLIKVCITGKLPSGRTKSKFYEDYKDKVTETSVDDAEYVISNKLDSNKTQRAIKLGKSVMSEGDFIKEVLS